MTHPDADDRLGPAADPQLVAVANRAIGELTAYDPVEATYLGDHTHDAELPDPGVAAADRRARGIRELLAELDALTTSTPDDDVDAAVLRTVHAAALLDLDEIREAEWNPMRHNPGQGMHALLSREFAPLGDRLVSLAGRLAAVDDHLAAARERLRDMSQLHLDTAVDQLGGALALLDTALPAALDAEPGLRAQFAAPTEGARAALTAHREWLTAQRADARRDPRLGPDLFRTKLALVLDTAFEPQALLHTALGDLEEIEDEIVATAGRLAGVARPDQGTVREVLDRLADDAPTDATILDHCRAALVDATEFVRGADLVSVLNDRVDVVAMPEIDRGVAVAYCLPNGALESAPLPTQFAVSPTPAGWNEDRVRSFYREYNLHMVQDLTVHEAMPGHALQLMHAARHRAGTSVRAVWYSGSFVEGWAVYAEELMALAGYRSAVSPDAAAALRMQQLKMQLRTTINAILDIRYHCEDLDEAAALDLMCGRGYQEIGEAAGKWRRVQLTSTQLSTYYVGYREVRDVANDLTAAQPSWSRRQVHDAMLAHGSPPARHLRTLLGLGPARV